MPEVLGVRAEPSAIHWAIVSGTTATPILQASGTETAPRSFREGEALAWIRQRVVYIIETYSARKVAIRYAERTAKGANKDSAKARCRVEGVVLEAAGSKNLEVVAATMKTFASHSGSDSPKEDLASDHLRQIDWSEYNNKLQEAIYVAFSLLPGG
jgi:Holliday junction resolvasome RuvABC endonuclease subunit